MSNPNKKSTYCIHSLENILVEIPVLKREGKQIVFTNGCFDIIHLGHVEYLYKAKMLGDILIVAINSDNSVKQIKGDKRPIVTEKIRASIVAALKPVDYTLIFDDPDPERIIKIIKPDILVKGGDWSEDTVIGANYIKSIGGHVEIIPYLSGFSSSSIISKIIKLYSTNNSKRSKS